MLTIALPKGRIAQDTLNIFEKVFKKPFIFDDKKLILEACGFKFLLVRSQDVPAYVLHQAADIGVVGLDVLEEQEADLTKLLDLGIGKCRICIGIPKDKELDFSLPEIKIATKMENIARKYFSQKAVAVKVIKLYGSIELAPLVGLADAIVDLVETGSTMEQNGLKIVETISTSSAHLVCNKNSFISKKEEILSIYDSIKEAVSLV
ncbi:MAG: ATP phosphoribosyltransferase [Campylobacteraceae bacterium]|jgi:ATP phosphoribosyltransferase|nr:ATP phosphoribosyltransferase [Campylobacteraceae bacterium]